MQHSKFRSVIMWCKNCHCGSCVLLIIAFIIFCSGVGIAELLEELDLPQTYVYYDLKSKAMLRITSIENSFSNSSYEANQPSIKFGFQSRPRRVGFRSNGCTCQELTCGCCTGFDFQQFNFNREGCMNITYDPYEFAITMNMFMNGNPIFTTKTSAKNPPPLCIPIPIPYLPMVDFCAKLFDIHTPGRNLHMCLDFETRIQRATILLLHFNCMRMGEDGISLVKPGESIGVKPPTTDGQIDADKYDEVTEIKLLKNPH